MKNYFETSNVNWNNWNPSNVVFKSNNLTKKLLPAKNVLSWKSKTDRNDKMCELAGCKKSSYQGYNGQQYHRYTRENYFGVMVELKNVKSEYPSACIDFIDYRDKKNSIGENELKLDVLVYLNSYHTSWQWQQQPNGQWAKNHSKQSLPLDEGYKISYGGQGDSNPMSFDTFQELLQISEAVRQFLIECVVPAKRGEFDYDQLLVA